MSNRFVIAGFAALGLVASFGAVRADMTPTAFLKAVDKDSDGTVTLDEVKAYAAVRFKALETDKDGTLDEKELKGRLSETGFKSANLDGDKTIDEKEFVAYVETLFKEANDKDTTLDAKELGTPAGKKLVMLLQ